MSRLFVRTGNGVVPVSVASVAWFEASGDYVTAHTLTSRHLLHLSLSRLQARLDPARFARIHRAQIVNLEQVAAFRRSGREVMAVLKNGVRLPAGRRRKASAASASSSFTPTESIWGRERTGLEVAAALKGQGLKTRVVILTTFARSGYLRRALDAGVSGYLLKHSPPDMLSNAVRRVQSGLRAIGSDGAINFLLDDLERSVPSDFKGG